MRTAARRADISGRKLSAPGGPCLEGRSASAIRQQGFRRPVHILICTAAPQAVYTQADHADIAGDIAEPCIDAVDAWDARSIGRDLVPERQARQGAYEAPLPEDEHHFVDRDGDGRWLCPLRLTSSRVGDGSRMQFAKADSRDQLLNHRSLPALFPFSSVALTLLKPNKRPQTLAQTSFGSRHVNIDCLRVSRSYPCRKCHWTFRPNR